MSRSILTLLALSVSAPALASHERPPEHTRPAPQGSIEVFNRSGTRLTVYVEGNAARSMGANETARFSVHPGEVSVRATYRQFGQEFTLDSDRVLVHPRTTARETFYPEDTARVLVENASPFDAELRANGRTVATLRGHESRVVALPAGDTTLTMATNGRVTETRRLSLRPYDEPRVRFELPAFGDLVVVNPLPIPVELVCDRGMVRTVEPYGRTVYERLPIGTFHVTARRVTDERIDDEVARISAYGQTTWRIDAPRDGLLTVDNDHWLTVRVLVDGNAAGSLAPEADRRLLLSVGWHHVVARDADGRVIADTWIEVEPFDVARIDVGRETRGPVGNRYDHGYTDAAYTADAHSHGTAASCTLPHQ